MKLVGRSFAIPSHHCESLKHLTCSMFAGGCLNITCFRCGDIGHHSKTCYKPRVYSKAVICTRCSSSHHSSKDCEESNQTASGRYRTYYSRIVSLRCICLWQYNLDDPLLFLKKYLLIVILANKIN